jgi:hypothetical protein
MKSYLIEYHENRGGYCIFSVDNLYFSLDSNYQLVAKDIPPEVISAAIYQLLESLKDHTPAGHEKATGE